MNRTHLALGRYALGGVLLLIALIACRQESTIQAPSPEPAGRLAQDSITYLFDVEAIANEESPVAVEAPTARIASMRFDLDAHSGNGRTYILPRVRVKEGLGSSSVSSPQVESILALYNATSQKTTLVPATWYVKVATEGTCDCDTLSLRQITTPAGIDLTSGTWYMMGVVGGGEINGNELIVKSDTLVKPVRAGETVTMNVPFFSSWRRLAVRTTGSGTSAKKTIVLEDASRRMRFATRSAFLLLEISNYMPMDVRLNRTILLDANSLSGHGKYRFPQGTSGSDVVSADGALLSDDAFVPLSTQTAGTRKYAEYASANYPHYYTHITLQRDGDRDGSDFSGGRSDYDQAFYLKKRSGATPDSLPSTYIVALTKYRDGQETIFYGDADVIEQGRTHYTSDDATYTDGSQPTAWKPRLGKRYVLGSTGNWIGRGSVYRIPLRVIRPMLPAERLHAGVLTRGGGWNVSGGASLDVFAGENADAIGLTGGTALWRKPRVTELLPLVRLPKGDLDNATSTTQPMMNGRFTNMFNSLNPNAYIRPSGTPESSYTRMDARAYSLGANYRKASPSEAPAGNVYYALAYLPGAKGNGLGVTSNYVVAMRMTTGVRTNVTADQPGTYMLATKVETYYLGPNFYMLQDNVTEGLPSNFSLHAGFWEEFDPQAIITRYIPYGVQPGNRPKQNLFFTADVSDGTEPRSAGLQLLDDGRYHPVSISGVGYHLPWLIDPAW